MSDGTRCYEWTPGADLCWKVLARLVQYTSSILFVWKTGFLFRPRIPMLVHLYRATSHHLLDPLSHKASLVSAQHGLHAIET